jgi:hypothetical protein
MPRPAKAKEREELNLKNIMKKLFLIPLLTLMCSVMAWAADAHVSSFSELKSAVETGSATTVYLDKDIEYRVAGANKGVNITRSLTIDGQGHSLTGYAGRNDATNGTFISLNHGSAANTYSIDVTIKNLTINEEKLRAIETRSNVGSLTLENCTINVTGAGCQQPLTIGGSQSSAADINLINTEIAINPTSGSMYYPIITFNPINLTMTNCKTKGWCAVYFKPASSSEGSHGSTMVATNCVFDSQNYNSGNTNSYGAFVLEDDNIEMTLDNCVVNVTAHDKTGVAKQALFVLSSWAKDPSKYCQMTIKGSNSHVIGDFILKSWPEQVPVLLELQGGSYYGKDFETAIAHPNVSIPTGYHAEQVNQGGEDIYRIVKDAAEKTPGVKYDLNDNVEGEGAGENPVTSFELSTGTDMTLNNDTTKAGYVQVKDNGTTPTTVTVGQTAGGDDQTLIVNEGLDVQGKSQVIVEPGATLQIGEGGIVTEKPENIVIEANENGAASMIMDPTITINTMPNLTVKMTAKQIGRDAAGDFYWHRYAMPVASITTWEKEGSFSPAVNPTYPTYVYAWDYTANDWASITPSAMVPLQGYTLTLASNWINPDGSDAGSETGTLNVLQDVTYIFKGNLVGNTNQPLTFRAEGFNFFGNSYTGYIDVTTLLQGLGDNHIDGTAYMWCNDPDNDAYQTYVGVSLYKLIKGKGLEAWQKEVAPMQTFILRLRGADNADESVDYASAIWGNPRYKNNKSNSGAGAPRRRAAAISEDTYMEIAVKAANGKGSRVDFTESANNSDAFESGYDVEKYINEKTINLYATVDGVNLSSVVTNMIAGKTLSLKTNDEIAYTMSFKNVEGEEYAIRDNVTGQVIAIEEGTTYEFAAQPNSTVEGRFEIVARHEVPTAVENTEVKANVKGIYTIMGQYLGENFDILPAGVYVVDGVKIVK